MGRLAVGHLGVYVYIYIYYMVCILCGVPYLYFFNMFALVHAYMNARLQTYMYRFGCRCVCVCIPYSGCSGSILSLPKEMKGVPLRIELGPQDISKGNGSKMSSLR